MLKTHCEVNILVSNLKTLLPLANSHVANFITHNLFQKLIPKPMQEEIMSLDIDELSTIVLDSFSHVTSHEKIPKLSEFLCLARKLSLKENNICLPFEKLCEILKTKGLGDCSYHITKNLMSLKKSHEVEILSGIVASVAKCKNCTHIVDVGGGKGYLSSVLTLKYQLKVLSIDSSLVTSKGAVKQIPRIEKLWKNLQKKESRSDNTPSRINAGTQDNKGQGKSSELCKFATLFISEDTDVVEQIRHHFEDNDICNLILVGLHTCGNLAASSLRIFINNPEHMKYVINVGCCYHLIVEEFDTPPTWLDVELQASGYGFPMSNYLRELSFVLGRNARMLACQSMDRVSHEGMLKTDYLFYRALLEYYLKNKLCLGDGLPNFRVGKIAQKCSSFTEYVHKSIERLALHIEVNDEELQELYESHSEIRKQFHAFCLLRLAIAPALEAAIMLDRLLYLQEQGIEDAYLTQLFDPVVSPRCFGIIAFNKSYDDRRQVARRL